MSRPALAVLLVAVLGACAAPSPLDHPPVRLPGLSGAGRLIRSDSVEAQAWFDQGLTLTWGRHLDEAIRSFHGATLADPDCVMAWWGLALASRQALDAPLGTAQDGRRAHAAITTALALRGGAGPVEVALVEALAASCTWPLPADRSRLLQDHAAALRGVHERFPDDPDVASLYAGALLDLPAAAEAGDLAGSRQEALMILERVRATHPDHLGACRLLIRATEADQPERGLDAAERLAATGVGQLLHRSARLAVRLGRYADAVDRSEEAVAADQAQAAAGDPGRDRWLHARHEQLLAFAAMMEGREAVAAAAARRLVESLEGSLLRDEPALVDGLLATPLHVAIRFGRWEVVLEQPRPPAGRLLSRALWHHARGLALGATGRLDQARAEQQAFEQAAARVPADWRVGANPAGPVLEVARQVLSGELLWRAGETEAALEALREGVRLEDQLVPDGPPGWLQPVRHALGAFLMADGRFAEAEQVYRADLQRHGRNGWSLLGLMQALSAQGDDGPAQTVSRWLGEAWERADSVASSSCFCQPGVVGR